MAKPKISSKFVQITVSMNGDENNLYALDENGNVWVYDNNIWFLLPGERQI